MAQRRRSRQSSEEGSALGLAILVGLVWLWTQITHLQWQWLVASSILLGSVLAVAIPASIRRRHSQQRLRLFQTSAADLHYTQFGQRVQHVLHDTGWQRVQHVGGSGDGGIDLRGLRNGQPWIVQCKRYKDLVAPQHIRDLYGTLQDEMTRGGAVGALLVTTRRFSQDTRNWANGKPLELWDGYDLARIEAENEAAVGWMRVPRLSRVAPSRINIRASLRCMSTVLSHSYSSLPRQIAQQMLWTFGITSTAILFWFLVDRIQW